MSGFGNPSSQAGSGPDNGNFSSGFPNGGGNGNQDMGLVPGNQDAQKNTLWMGELEPWMDELFIQGVFGTAQAEEVQVKVIRDKASGNAGYCFVEFKTPAAAQRAVQELNGLPIPNSSRVFKLNRALGGGLRDRRDERAPEYSIFVGDLAPDINEFVLVSLFQSRFASCKSAKIMTDNTSGQSRGYGFVRFSSQDDQDRALVEMQGVYCGNRPMRISTATPKSRHNPQFPMGPGQGPMGGGQGMPMTPFPPPAMWNGPVGPVIGQQMSGFGQGFGAPQYPTMNQFTDPNNTTVFVGGLSGYVTEDELRSFFQGFGEITYVKIPPGKGCGFVQFVHRHAAEMAINQMQGYPIGNSRVRLSWGRSQSNSGVGTPYRPAPAPPIFGHGPHSGGLGPNGPHGLNGPHGPNGLPAGPGMYMGGPPGAFAGGLAGPTMPGSNGMYTPGSATAQAVQSSQATPSAGQYGMGGQDMTPGSQAHTPNPQKGGSSGQT